MLKRILLACFVVIGAFVLSSISPSDVDAAVSKFKTRVSPSGCHAVSREHHRGSVKLRSVEAVGAGASCAAAIRSAPRAASCSAAVGLRRTVTKLRASAVVGAVGVRAVGVCGACGGQCGIAGCMCGCQQ